MARCDRLAVVAGLLLAGCAPDAPESGTAAADDRGGVAMSVSELRAQLHGPIVPAQLRVLASGAAADHGVAVPATLRAVAASDHQASESVITGADVHDHAPVFVVQATGGVFTAGHAPPGVAPPTGSVLTVSYAAATLEITDLAITNAAPDLRAIDAEVVDLVVP